MNGSFRGERTILFGGSGFLGPYILAAHPEMISVGRPAPTTPHLEKEVLPRGEPTAFDHHLVPFVQAMEQLKQFPIRKLIHFSTILIYDDKRLSLPVDEHAPIDPYKNRYVLSKYMAEEACKFYRRWTPILNVRFSNLYGPTPLKRYDLIHVLIRQLLREGSGEVWSTRPERDFIYVEDAADAIVKLLFADHTGTINLGTGTMTPVRRIVDLLQEWTGCPIRDLDRAVAGPARFRCDLEEGLRATYERMRGWSYD
jgi:nucleoside-diphosphate-sugar epimerase